MTTILHVQDLVRRLQDYDGDQGRGLGLDVSVCLPNGKWVLKPEVAPGKFRNPTPEEYASMILNFMTPDEIGTFLGMEIGRPAFVDAEGLVAGMAEFFADARSELPGSDQHLVDDAEAHLKQFAASLQTLFGKLANLHRK